MPADGESVTVGGEIYAINCALCHGDTGLGDGAGAVGLNPAPADLNERVQDRTAGELFWIVTNGSKGTAMPPWEAALNEEDRWHVVNYLQDEFG